ncbi:MAG: hypothetical protein V1664_00200 [Candidatus Uhrbacteria bacterium]
MSKKQIIIFSIIILGVLGAIFYTNYFKTSKTFQPWGDKYSDFQISPDKKYVATTEKSSDLSKQILTLLNNDNSETIIKTFSLSDLNIPNNEAAIWTLAWSEQNKLWIRAQMGRQIISLISFEEPNFLPQQYNLESENVTTCDFAFNVEQEVLVFSDFCPSDTLDLEDAVKNKTKTTLYLYDLKTQNKRVVAEAVAKEFLPVWVDDQTVEYNDPNSDSREKQSIN